MTFATPLPVGPTKVAMNILKCQPTARAVNIACSIVVLTLLSGMHVFAGQGVQRMLFTRPNTTFVEQPSGETVVNVNDTSGSISTLQASINSARNANPTNVIIIRLLTNATYSVSTTGIVLGSHECLVADNTTIMAANVSITVPLITISSDSTNVSVAGGVLDAGGANVQGIYAPAAARVNVDKVIVKNCGQDCILLKGIGNTSYDNEMTVTRCDVSGSAAHAGISIQNSTQTAVLDNYCHNNFAGIWLSCAWANVANNVCVSNTTAIDVNGGDDNVIANNTCNNNGTGIHAGASNNMLISNSLGTNSAAGIKSDGTGNSFVDNLFVGGNTTNFTSAGSGNHVVAYKTPLNAPGEDYFYPPLANDQHTNPIVNGMGRTDLTISSTTIDSVQSQYNSARAANPNNVIVLHLNGTFPVGATPLTLQSNSCVLLNGTIQISSSTGASAAITGGTSPAHVSISGGVIDGSGLTGNNGVYIASGTMLQLDSVTLQNFGPDNPRVGGSDVVRFTGGATPQIITRCLVNGGAARGIWLENSGVKRVVSDCEVTAVNQDGVDCDASTSGSVIKFNYCHDLVRYGVFFEQSASHDLALGNICNNDGRDINIYNNSVTPRGDTAFNNVLCNWCLGNNGLRNGSTGTNVVQSSHNFLFNNIIANADIESQLYGTQNYYSQNYLTGGALSTAGVEEFFNATDVSSNLYVQDSNSGLVILVKGAATTNNAPAIIGAPPGTGNDQWTLIPTDSGYYQIRNQKSGLDLTVTGASTSAGALVIQYSFGSGKNDQWMPMAAGNGLYYFVNRHSGLCLDVPAATGGTQLDQQSYTGGANQQFNLQSMLAVIGPVNPFVLSASPNLQAVIAGGTNTYTVTLSTNSGFSGYVNFTVTGLPPNSTASFSPASLGGNATSTLTVGTASNTPVGVYPLVITGAGSGATNTISVNFVVNSGVVALPGTLLWTGTNNWSVAQNWTNVTSGGFGPPGISNDVIFTNYATVATSNTPNNIVNSSVVINSLTFNNTNGFHTTQITPAATLAIDGSKGISVGTESDLGGTAAVYDSVMGTGATLLCSNSSANLIIRQGAAAGGAQRATLDLSGLDQFTASLNQISVGVAGPVVRATGTLLLANTNFITASGSIGILAGDNNSNGGGQDYLYLGRNNYIFADNITIGRQKASATLAFNAAFQNSFVYFRAANGTGRVSNWFVGDNSAQSSSSSSAHGTVDFSGGTVDALVDTLVIGKSQKTTGVDTFGTMTFASGTLDVNTLQVGYQAQSGATSAGIGTLNVTGGLVNANAILELAHTSGGTGTTNTTGTMNLWGGTVQTTNLAGGGGISTINLNSGTINLAGGSMTNISALNLGAAAVAGPALLENASTILVSNVITIAANGTLAGNSFVIAPALVVEGTISPGFKGIGGITNSATTVLGPGGRFIVSVQDTTGSPASGWDFLQSNGGLDLAASSTNPFTIQLQSFANGQLDEVTNFSADTNYTWTIATAPGSIAGFDAEDFIVDATLFANDLQGGYFYLAPNGNGLALCFTNNRPPTTGIYRTYQSPSGLAIPISSLAGTWSDPDGDPVVLSDVNDTSSNGIPVTFDSHFIYYGSNGGGSDAIFYTVEDVRTNPPAIYRSGDTPRTASGEIILIPPPAFTSTFFSPTNLVVTGTGGITNGSYFLLVSTNLSSPPSQWRRIATNNFDATGDFDFTNVLDPNAPEQFYLIQLP